MHCLDSDFLVTEMVTFDGFVRASTIKRLAHRVAGIGFEFFLLIEHPKQPAVDFDCLLFDAEGRKIAVNYAAARCAARYVRDNGLTGKSRLQLSFGQQTVGVELLNKQQISVTLAAPEFAPEKIGLQVERYKAEYDLPVAELGHIQFGALKLQQLHLTMRVEDISQTPDQHWAELIRQQAYFQSPPQVSFLQTIDDQHLHLVNASLEPRCVLDEAAAAAVVFAHSRGWLAPTATVICAQHELLIEWNEGQSLSSTSAAHYVYDGRVYI